MRRFFATTALPFALLATAATAQQAAPAPKLAPLSQLVGEVDIPYQTFTLPNGLETIVHTDRKAPIVGVTVYYRVGSKNEPRGRTGFAHLFEHLMFGGSENVENFDIPLEAAGSTSTNGSTWYDRTNYIEVVPTGALDLALFEESDRMGYLLGAVNQDKLDKQRGVVQNEKRQGDNQPYGLVEYHLNDNLFPVGHPYRHTTIGSMADLDAASLTDVRKWFTDHYGPNNVVLAITGDIDLATAKQKVAQWFGDIPRGPEVKPVAAAPVTLKAPVRETITDQVPVTRIIRAWTGPALTATDAVPLQAGLYVLGGLASSRLDNALVRGEELAVSVTAGVEQHEQIGFIQAQMDVKPGVDVAMAEKRFDTVIDDLVRNGPTKDELQRAATDIVSSQIGALELVGGFSGKGATLAEGELYAHDPAHYKKELAELAALTPAQVKATLQKWLTRPAYTLTIKPGERTEDGALLGGWGDEGKVPPPPKDPQTPVAVPRTAPPRPAPPVAEVKDLTFPAIEHARLSNGIDVELARRTAIPKVSLALTFDAGNAADDPAHAGTQSLMLDALEEGTTTRSAEQIAAEQERLGASISASSTTDSSQISMTALTANLLPSLELMADIARHPGFAESDIARVKNQRLAEISQEQASPVRLAQRAIRPLIYGPGHPYGSVGGTGRAAVIEALTPAALRAEHDKWLRPDLAHIVVVGDVTMAELLPKLETAFGSWKAPAGAAPVKAIDAPIPAPQPRLVVIDRPNSPQSVLLLGRALPLKGSGTGQEAVELANEVIGNDFLSRLNSDLREDKGWTYGISSSLLQVRGPRGFIVLTPVQTDRTADSIKLIIEDMKAFPKAKGVDAVELQRVTEGNIRNLPNRFETNGQVLGALLDNQRLGRPDDYQTRLPEIYRSLDAKAIDAAATQYLQPEQMVIVVVGDRKEIDAQLKTLGMPIEYMEAKDL
uniref:M16 family metallopeptidase n=1 Tax=Altererythrobacter segetis TaxID=1104773 RepID=UPI00140BC17D|nr:pitrilysin family protein [Altererythrobacter segetis]